MHQKQAKAAATEGEMGRFTKEDIGYLAMKQVSEGKVRAPLRRCARPPRTQLTAHRCAARCYGQKVQRLRASLHELDAVPKNTHTLFVDGEREAARFKKPQDFARHLNTSVALLGRASHRPRTQAEGSAEGAAAAPPAPAAKAKAPTKKEERAKAAKYSELKQREAREAKLTAHLAKLRSDKVMHSKGQKRKMTADDGKPRQYKFKQVRQR